ncbi:MAG TPA: hypothetical protein VFE33_00375 [Thermoanaerobaculia bacterium]|nr:hypothetical protein [Thermoanaerobaculia bacterium]
MPSRASIVLVLAADVGGSVTAGCGSGLQPRPLTAAQASRVDAFGQLGAVAVEAPDEVYARILGGMLQRTGLFRTVAVTQKCGGPIPAAVDYVATMTGRCSGRHGGFIPWLPILTLGVLPQFRTAELGFPFTLRQLSTGQEVAIPCEIRSTFGLGWIPLLMNVLPGWSLADPERSPNYSRRLAYLIAERMEGWSRP